MYKLCEREPCRESERAAAQGWWRWPRAVSVLGLSCSSPVGQHTATPAAALFLPQGDKVWVLPMRGDSLGTRWAIPGPDTPVTTLGPERPGHLRLPLRRQERGLVPELGPVLLLLVPP